MIENTLTHTGLFDRLDTLILLHQKHDCVWSDFLMSCKERITRDPAFGYDFLLTAWGGMFNYEEFGTLADKDDEAKRLQLASETYDIAKEMKYNVQN
jgi:hypothetical protein